MTSSQLFPALLLAAATLGLVHSQGTRIVFPGERPPPSLLERLDLSDSRVRTRFQFPSSGDSCTTETGAAGLCRPLARCPVLLTFVGSKGTFSRTDIAFLRGRICRFVSNEVHLCCASPPPRPTPAPPGTRVTNTTRSNQGSGEAFLPDESECGFSLVSKITDGVEYRHGTHPWLVGVGYPREGRDAPFRVLCGGTLITRRHVITAAHCFVRRPGFRALSHVRLGEHSLSRADEEGTVVTLEIASRVDPGYDSTSHLNDIELLTMQTDVQFSRYIRPACLPFPLRDDNFQDAKMTIVGWGDTFFRSFAGNDVPLAAEVQVVSKPVCREAYRSEPQVPLDETQFCLGQGTKDACQGDSGGPLLFEDLTVNFKTFLMGVVSFGVECANPLFPGVYTFVPEFLDWITQNLKAT